MKAIYLRTSTEEQNPQNQLNDCLSLANPDQNSTQGKGRQKSAPVKVYEEKQSAWKENRNIPMSIRKAVRIRDNNKCRKCTIKKNLEFHHIISFFELGKYSKFKENVHNKNNLILLCYECHKSAPDDPIEFFKWLRKGKDLPPSFSKCIELIEMGLPMVILKRVNMFDKGYNLDVDMDDVKELVSDFKKYLIDLWEMQISIEEDKDNGMKHIGNFIKEQFNGMDFEKLKERNKRI